MDVCDDEPALCVSDASRVTFADLEKLSAGEPKMFIWEVPEIIVSAERGR